MMRERLAASSSMSRDHCRPSRVAPVNGFDAVCVGSGIDSLAGAALLAKEGWRVCVLERNDWLGGAIKTVDGLTAPGFTHKVFSFWHPLWVGSRPTRSEGGPRPARAGVPEHRPPHRRRVSRRVKRVSRPTTPQTPPSWARVAASFDEFMGGAGIAFASSAPSSGRARSLARRRPTRIRPPWPRRVAVHTLLSARDWLGRRSSASRPTGCWRRGCCTPGSAPTRRSRAS